MIKLLITLISISTISASIFADGISVSQKLSSSEIAFEDSVLFEIELSWDGSQAAYLFPKPLSPVIDRMTVRGFSSSVSSETIENSERTIKKYRYVLLPKSSGVGRISPITISYITWPDSLPGELITSEMNVKIAKPLPSPEPFDYTLIWWLGGVVLIAAVGLVIVIIRRTRNKQPSEPVKTVVEQFLDELGQLKNESGNDHKRFQTGLHKILNEFLSRQYDLSPEYMTEDDLKEQLLSAGLADQPGSKIATWFAQAARDKFSPVLVGPGETIRLEAEIRQLFEKL
jgi:hypothetical protein